MQLEFPTSPLRRLQELGHEAFYVGGCVRDALMGLPPRDLD